MAFWTTLCTLAPLPICNLLFMRPHCPLLCATSSDGPKTGQKSKGAGSDAEALRKSTGDSSADFEYKDAGSAPPRL